MPHKSEIQLFKFFKIIQIVYEHVGTPHFQQSDTELLINRSGIKRNSWKQIGYFETQTYLKLF